MYLLYESNLKDCETCPRFLSRDWGKKEPTFGYFMDM